MSANPCWLSDHFVTASSFTLVAEPLVAFLQYLASLAIRYRAPKSARAARSQAAPIRRCSPLGRQESRYASRRSSRSRRRR